MLAPLPIQIGPPTQYALSRRPHLLYILIAQSLICALRIAVTLDILGGFIMAMTIGIGCYGWKDDMNITFIIYWGMLSAINGVFDIIRLVELAVNSPVPLLSKELPMALRCANFIVILVPIVELIGVPMSCYLYQDYMDNAIVIEPVGPGRWADEGGMLPPGGFGQLQARQEERYLGAGQRLNQRPTGGTFRPFEGEVHRLSC
eukprot:TRINITY_DN513_c0_g2_i1.p1 TRINITY_DN513_c0_g2~~TRINITY_DN513_c0_g2_i1.p1  ORF type:complete len:203 (+),score=25.03 TRINITY_DN513_c0_g2_i1:134-742(+)